MFFIARISAPILAACRSPPYSLSVGASSVCILARFSAVVIVSRSVAMILLVSAAILVTSPVFISAVIVAASSVFIPALASAVIMAGGCVADANCCWACQAFLADICASLTSF